MNKRTERLHQLMEQHQLNAAKVADILGRAPSTVSMWRVGTPRTIPQHALDLLEFRLGKRR